PANPAYGYGQPQPLPGTPPSLCRECGVVQAVRQVNQQGEASGLGAVAGGVLGGVLGNQVGKGGGRKAATVIGAVGGAVAGHQIEKSQRSHVIFETTVRFEDGSVRVFNQESQPYWRQGDRVRYLNGSLNAY
ncbi:MAG TPA: glycine zipper 2TM domain-containing protein, partial [Rhodocyclaceae bacterium]|nr:glycine zipper 2TM domain-containing protein [Rhodocyclaceae bacterium]